MEERPALLNAVIVRPSFLRINFFEDSINAYKFLFTHIKDFFFFLMTQIWIMLLKIAQDILHEEKPRLICGLGLPGTITTTITMNFCLSNVTFWLNS